MRGHSFTQQWIFEVRSFAYLLSARVQALSCTGTSCTRPKPYSHSFIKSCNLHVPQRSAPPFYATSYTVRLQRPERSLQQRAASGFSEGKDEIASMLLEDSSAKRCRRFQLEEKRISWACCLRMGPNVSVQGWNCKSMVPRENHRLLLAEKWRWQGRLLI